MFARVHYDVTCPPCCPIKQDISGSSVCRRDPRSSCLKTHEALSSSMTRRHMLMSNPGGHTQTHIKVQQLITQE